MIVMYFKHAIINKKHFPNSVFIRIRKEVEDELASIESDCNVIRLDFNPARGSMQSSWINIDKEIRFKKYYRSNYIIEDGAAARGIVQYYNIFIANTITAKYFKEHPELECIDYDNFPSELKDRIISNTIFFSREFYEDFSANFNGYNIV